MNKLYQEVLWRRNVSQDPVNYEETEHIVKLAEKVFTKADEYPQRLEIILMHYDTLLTAGSAVVVCRQQSDSQSETNDQLT